MRKLGEPPCEEGTEQTNYVTPTHEINDNMDAANDFAHR